MLFASKINKLKLSVDNQILIKLKVKSYKNGFPISIVTILLSIVVFLSNKILLCIMMFLVNLCLLDRKIIYVPSASVITRTYLPRSGVT